jgi:hypothetical protein
MPRLGRDENANDRTVLARQDVDDGAGFVRDKTR